MKVFKFEVKIYSTYGVSNEANFLVVAKDHEAALKKFDDFVVNQEYEIFNIETLKEKVVI